MKSPTAFVPVIALTQPGPLTATITLTALVEVEPVVATTTPSTLVSAATVVAVTEPGVVVPTLTSWPNTGAVVIAVANSLSVVVNVLVSYTSVIVLLAAANFISARHKIGAVVLGIEAVAKLAVSAPAVDKAGWLLAPVKHRCWKLPAPLLVADAVPAVTIIFLPPEYAVQAFHATPVVAPPIWTWQGPLVRPVTPARSPWLLVPESGTTPNNCNPRAAVEAKSSQPPLIQLRIALVIVL
jgi:hypothetical protein